MDETRESLLREKGFGFFGAMTASLSHEINNVYAIINELSGLLGDFCYAAEQGSPLDVERLKGTSQRIGAQVERGQEYVKRLNRFAHTVDDGQATVVLNETVDAIATLCRRLAKLRRVEIEVQLPEESPTLQGSAFDLQHIVFRCIDIVMDASAEGDVIGIGVEPNGDGVRLVFAGRSELETEAALESKKDFLTVLVSEVGGGVEPQIEVGRPVRLEVSLPHRLSSPPAVSPQS